MDSVVACGEEPPITFESWCHYCGFSDVEVSGCHAYCPNCFQVSEGCGD